VPITGRPWVHYKYIGKIQLSNVKHRIKIVSFEMFSKVVVAVRERLCMGSAGVMVSHHRGER